MPAGGKREVGFAYGLGSVSSSGKLLMTVDGSFKPGGDLTVTALVSNPAANETITLSVPDGFQIDGSATQKVPEAAADASSRNRPVDLEGQGRADRQAHAHRAVEHGRCAKPDREHQGKQYFRLVIGKLADFAKSAPATGTSGTTSMSFRAFIYYCALCGGWAALVGWLLGRIDDRGECRPGRQRRHQGHVPGPAGHRGVGLRRCRSGRFPRQVVQGRRASW